MHEDTIYPSEKFLVMALFKRQRYGTVYKQKLVVNTVVSCIVIVQAQYYSEV